MRVPSISKEYVQSFCRSVVPDGRPIYVSVKALPDEEPNQCFAIVPEHIRTHGGKQKIGWAIWEWPRVLIEAEFHCVWESPEGNLVDITPKDEAFDRVVFLPDPEKNDEGRSVNNIRRPLSKDRDISRFIAVWERIFQEKNRGDLASYYGEIPPTQVLFELYNEVAKLQLSLMGKYGNP